MYEPHCLGLSLHGPHRVAFFGSVYAGSSVPMDAWQILRYHDLHLVSKPQPGERIGMCKVEGNSLEAHGILEGDFVIFFMREQARPSDLIVADTPFGTTVKYYDPTEEGVWLRAADAPSLDQFWSSDEVKIRGVVTETRRLIR
jgi:SOS-response transcriptional repressor LexA